MTSVQTAEKEAVITRVNETLWEFASRLIVVVTLTAFGILQLYLLSQQNLDAEAVQAINIAYRTIGVFFGVYVAIPAFELGVDHWSHRAGKVLVVTALLAVLGMAVWGPFV